MMLAAPPFVWHPKTLTLQRLEELVLPFWARLSPLSSRPRQREPKEFYTERQAPEHLLLRTTECGKPRGSFPSTN